MTFKPSQPLVFLSRDKEDWNSLPWKLEKLGCNSWCESLIEFEDIHGLQIPTEAEWLFFYSARAVESFLRLYQDALDEPRRLACLGKSAHAAFLSNGIRPDFVGNGIPDKTGSFFVSLARNDKVLFLQATASRSSIQQLFGRDMDYKSMAIYHNTAKASSFDISAPDVLVFTSSLNVKGFLTAGGIESHQSIVAIGPSTARTLHEAGYKTVRVAKAPDEDNLMRCIEDALENDIFRQ